MTLKNFTPASCFICACVLQVGSGLLLHAQNTAAAPSSQKRPSLTLSPAVIMLKAQPGQSTTQSFTITNELGSELQFDVSIEDVAVVDGKRVSLKAGQTPNGIAANAIAAPASVLVKPGHNASVNVTITIPPGTQQRAVIVYFRGKVPATSGSSVAMGASLGTLVTFNLSDACNLESGPMSASTQTATANVVLSQELRNSGSEPIVPKGTVAILNDSGKLVGKATFDAQRLLPGERLVFAATNPMALRPGHYRAVSSFQYEGKVLSSAGEFTVLE